MSDFKSTEELELRIRELERIRSECYHAETELRANLDGLALLLRTNEALSRSLVLPEILQSLTDSATLLLPGGTAAVYLLEGDHLYLGATTPPLPEDFPEAFRLAPLTDHPVIARALENNRPELIADTRAAEHSPAERRIIEARDLRTILHIPLAGTSRPLGVYIVGTRGKPRAISDFETTLCRTLGTQAGIAIENARLYEAARHQLQERERLQAQLLQAQKMESVGRLAGGVAHDFNNMLNVILGHAELELEDLPEDSPHRDGLKQILDAARRSADLTRQLLAFARKQKATPRRLDLNAAVESMLKMLGRLIGEDIELTWEPGAGLAPVSMDPGQIDQLLANLAVNARDAVETGTGRVTIRTARADLDEEAVAAHPDCPAGEHVLLEIEDNGCGMDDETRAHIFDPFFTTKDVGRGTGLGLSTVYGIVHQNRGLIDVQSAPDLGSRFRIFLPADRAGQAAPNSPADTATPVRGTETLLVVEDEDSILHLTRTILGKLGYRVLAAATPGEALELAASHPGSIDLLLSDVIMPEMDGRRLSELLRQQRPELKRLFMSGYTADAVASEATAPDEFHFLQKPFSASALARAVRAALD